MTLTVERRRQIERQIARKVVEELLAQGFKLRVDNGEDYFHYMTDADTILSRMFAVDDEYLRCRKDKIESYVRFIYGNTGWDVIADYGVSLEPYLDAVWKLVDEIEVIL